MNGVTAIATLRRCLRKRIAHTTEPSHRDAGNLGGDASRRRLLPSAVRGRVGQITISVKLLSLVIHVLASLTELAAADTTTPPVAWRDDFSDNAAFHNNWRPYGWLADGITPETPLGKPASGAEARSEWWQLIDGVLQGHSIPEEGHPPGIQRALAAQNLRLRCRFQITAGSLADFRFNGSNRILGMTFHLGGIRVFQDRIVAFDNDVMYPKDSPEAAELAKQGVWNRKFFFAKLEKVIIAPDVWHDIVIEWRGRDISAEIDGKAVLQYTTLCGDAPKSMLTLGVGSEKKRPGIARFDDVEVQPITAP
jgi:hypothetical protein